LLLWLLGLCLGLLWGLLAGRRHGPGPCLTVSAVPLIPAVALLALAVPFCSRDWARSLFLTRHALMCILLWRNRRLPGMWLASAGAALNLAAILSAGGRMPVHPSVTELSAFTHVTFDGHWLNWFGDWIPIATPAWPAPVTMVVSPGDLLITLGLIWAVRMAVAAARSGRERRAAES
jgi:hypothetical protein